MVPNATLDIRIIFVLCVDAVAVAVAVAVVVVVAVAAAAAAAAADAAADSEVAGEADVDEDGSATIEAFSLVGGVVGVLIRDSIWVVAEEGWRATLCIAIACVSSIGRGH